jgi:predicted metal-dependent peptidase
LDPRTEKIRLEAEIYIEPEVRAQAEQIFSDAKRKLALKKSVLSSIAVGVCHVAFTRVAPTFAVKLTGDGNPLLLINPDYAIKLGADNAVFVLSHEVYHLLLLHVNPGLHPQDETWTVACEAWINNRVKHHINQSLPLVKDEKGEEAPQGVDPDKVYETYRTGAKKAGFEPVTREIFYKTDQTTYTELCRLPKPPKQHAKNACVHMSGDGDGDGQGQGESGSGDLDQEQVDILMTKLLSQTLRDAVNGSAQAKAEIESLMDASPDCKTWGDIGAGILRGETSVVRTNEQWLNWTINMVGTKMADGLRLSYNRKVWWDPRVSSIGREEKRHGLVAIDASGSMSADVLAQIADTVGEDERIEIEWCSFDGSVWPFEAGESFKGGGGTSFQIIDDYVADLDEEQDFVLVITDGYAPHITPKEPDKWIWLIVPGGDTWPEAAGMSCREIDLKAGKV